VAKRRKKKRRKQQALVEVRIIGPPARELVERIRELLKEELVWREKRYQKAPNRGLEWAIRRYERALDALNELEKRATK